MSRHTLVIVVLVATGCMKLDSFLFFPVPSPASADLMASSNIPLALREERFFAASDGTLVDTYLLFHSATDGTPVQHHKTGILYCHGNARNIGYYAYRAEALWSQGYTILIFDYRGYGKTRGVPSEAGVYMDGRVARSYLESLTSLGLDPSRVALYGYSLGTTVATRLAVEQHSPALIIESAFASVPEMINDNEALVVPSAWYVDSQFDIRGTIGQHTGGFLVLHGVEDMFISARYGHEIFDAAHQANPLRSWFVPSADHDTVPCANRHVAPDSNGRCAGDLDPKYLATVADFIDEVIVPLP